MAETSSSPTVHHTPEHAGKIGDLLKQKTAGLPNWAWLLVIAGGVAFAIFAPKFLNKSNTANDGGSSPIKDTSNNTGGNFGDGNFGGNQGGGSIDLSGLNSALEEIAKNMQSTNNKNNEDNEKNENNNDIPTPNPKKDTAKTTTTIKSATLESSPRNVNGKSIMTVPKGAKITILSGPPIPDPAGTSKKYYPVSYQGKSGYIGSDTLNLGSGSIGPYRSSMSWPTSYMRSRHIQIGA